MKWVTITHPYMLDFGESTERAYIYGDFRRMHGVEVMLWRVSDKWWIYPVDHPLNEFEPVYAGTNLEAAKAMLILLTDSEA